MFAQANSEHCRHKVFNADWIVDGETAPKSLFQMIRNTHARAPEGVLSAYRGQRRRRARAPTRRGCTRIPRRAATSNASSPRISS